MPIVRFPAMLLGTSVISATIGCTQDGGGGGEASSGATTTTTTPTSGVDDTAGTTSSTGGTTGGPTCTDVLGNNGSLMDAYALPLVADASEQYRLSLSAEICPSESDFFSYQPPCNGYLGVEVIVDDDGDDVTLHLRDAMNVLQTSNGNPATNRGAFRMEALHRIVDTTPLFFEVVHEAGDQVPYTITTYFLPDGSCTAAS